MITVWPEVYGMGAGAEPSTVPLPVDLPDVLFALRSARAVHRAATASSVRPTRGTRGRSSAPTSRATTRPSSSPPAVRSPRQHRRRGLLHDLRARRVAARTRRALGRHRRRAGPPLARWRAHLAERHAAGAAEWALDQHPRAVAARRRDVLRRGHALQARRPTPVSVQDDRLRPHLDAHHRRHPGRRVHARHPRGPEPRRAALRGHRDGRVRLVRRRRRTGSPCARICRSRRSTT